MAHEPLASYRLKPFQIGDLSPILRLERACFAQDAFDAQTFIWLHRLGADTFLVARADHTLIGYIAAYRDSDEGYIASLAVAPDYRRAGLGQVLIEAAAARFIQQGVRALTLHVRVNNHAAIALYTKLGFAIREMIPGYYEDGMDGLYMARRLPEG